MKTISIINLKGGVGKSISAINIGDVLTSRGNRVLLIDNDMQGNTTKFFKLHSYDHPSISDVLTVRGYDMREAIRHTKYSGLDLLPANMTLLRANKEIQMDVGWIQHTRLRKAMSGIASSYEYCIIDCSPYYDMSVINALVATDDVLIPIKADGFTMEGMEQLIDSIEQVGELNERIQIAGCFQTMYAESLVCRQAREHMHEDAFGLHVFDTVIRRTTCVDQSTFSGVPLNRARKVCAAARDYVALVDEYCAKH